MSQDRPQFYKNTLELPAVDKRALHQTLVDLQDAVLDGVRIIESGHPPSGQCDGKGIFGGDIGIGLAYLRLAQQTTSLTQNSESLPDFYNLAGARVPEHGPDFPLQIGGLSPLPSKSPLAAVVLRILHKSATGSAGSISDSDLTCLNDAMEMALNHGSVAFYNGHHLVAEFPFAQRKLLQPSLEAIPEVLGAIFEAGREGAAEFVKKHGEEGALPLMWPWLPGHYGFAGIIPILLSCDPDELSNNAHDYLPEIGATITALCKLCISHDGHLPTTIPPRSASSSRPSELVQICHGAPAILALLGCAKKHTDLLVNHWEPEWDHATRLAAERVWEEGLLSKGGSLCHGIAGNAWPFLLLHDVFEYHTDTLQKARETYTTRTLNPHTPESQLTGDYFLTRALAMLLHARETKPYNQEPEGTANDYRIPDQPYSFFEGLSGTVCAWAEAAAVIRARLRKFEVGGGNLDQDALFKKRMQQQLGFPCLGGNGVKGVL
ncbi:hypothetical protein BDV12DRAFT_208191 [Aspergillus spectabilis]